MMQKQILSQNKVILGKKLFLHHAKNAYLFAEFRFFPWEDGVYSDRSPRGETFHTPCSHGKKRSSPSKIRLNFDTLQLDDFLQKMIAKHRENNIFQKIAI